MCDWTNELTLRFLELYQNEPVIWDPTDPCHKDKKKIIDAWVRLSGQLECPVTELKKKKDSLMATFRGHLRKKKASIKSGAGANDIYKPVWFAYEYMESFLAPIIYECQTQDTAFFVTDELSPIVEIGSVYDEDNQSVVTGDRANITEKPTVRRCGTTPELREAGNQMKEAFNLLMNVITKRASDKEDDDEYDLFGKMLAKKIRKLPEHERDEFMYEIEGMYINKLRNVSSTRSNTESTEIIDPPPC